MGFGLGLERGRVRVTLGASVRSRGRSSGMERRWYQMGCSVRSMTAVSRSTPQQITLTYGSARPLLSAGCMSRLAIRVRVRVWVRVGVRVRGRVRIRIRIGVRVRVRTPPATPAYVVGLKG